MVGLNHIMLKYNLCLVQSQMMLQKVIIIIPFDFAIIFWGEGKATIIRIKSYTGCDRIVYCDCIDNSIYDYQGFDQDGDKWNICLGDYCI
jgi:hypothetical protein